MALKLKESGGASYNNYEDDLLDVGGTSNPWDNPRASSSMEPYKATKSIASTYVESRSSGRLLSGFMRVLMAIVVIGVVFFGGKIILGKIMPSGTDVTNLINKPEMEIQQDLGITFSDNKNWGKKMVQFSGDDATVRSNEDIGVVYIRKKHVGLHVHTNEYKLFDVQVGMSKKKVDELLSKSFQYDDIKTIEDDSGKGATSYVYYRSSKNDCIVIEIRQNTKRVDGITYYNNYKLIMKQADS
ncbi:MAG: hypothetical protein ACI4F4_08140 [Lachnospiraceae bacterium]